MSNDVCFYSPFRLQARRPVDAASRSGGYYVIHPSTEVGKSYRKGELHEGRHDLGIRGASGLFYGNEMPTGQSIRTEWRMTALVNYRLDQ
jgi:hypothetical protein